MIYLQLPLTLAIYIVMAEEAIQVKISADKADVSIGDSVTYTCTWDLDNEYDQWVKDDL